MKAGFYKPISLDSVDASFVAFALNLKTGEIPKRAFSFSEEPFLQESFYRLDFFLWVREGIC